MNVSASIPATVQIRRTLLVGLLVAVAVLAATVTWALSSLAFDGGASSTASPVRTSRLTSSSAARQTHAAASIRSLTPAQLYAGTLGGYALPSTDRPTIESVLSSMSPQTRRYTERIMNLTFAQLAAGAAGHP
jgi:hypothetical protein